MQQKQTNIKHKRTQTTHTETQNVKKWVMDHTSYKSPGYTPVKHYFWSWILAKVEQLFC